MSEATAEKGPQETTILNIWTSDLDSRMVQKLKYTQLLVYLSKLCGNASVNVRYGIVIVDILFDACMVPTVIDIFLHSTAYSSKLTKLPCVQVRISLNFYSEIFA